MSKMTPQIGNYSVKFVWHCTYREDCQWCGSFALLPLKLVLIFAISSVAMLEFNNYQIFHSQAGNVKNQQTVCRKDGQMTWKNRLLVICYVVWFDLISFSENIDFAENISTRKVQSKVFESFFWSFLINERPLMNFAGKIPEALKVAQATTIYDVRIDFLFVKCAWPDCFFPSRLRCLI